MKIDNSLPTAFNGLADTIRDGSGSTAPNDTPSVLPGVSELMVSGDPGAMLAALTMQTAHDEAKTSRAQRDACDSAQEKAEAAEVQDMHDKADLQRAQGVFDGVSQMAQGAFDLRSGLADAHSASETAEADAEKADIAQNGKSFSDEHVSALRDSANALENGAASSKATAAWSRGAGAAIGASKSFADGFFNGAITNKDADAKMHSASADAFKRMADDSHDNEKDAKELLNKALDFYKEYVDTKNQTTLAATHRA